MVLLEVIMKKLFLFLIVFGTTSILGVPLHKRNMCMRISHIKAMQEKGTPTAPFGCKKCTIDNKNVTCTGCDITSFLAEHQREALLIENTIPQPGQYEKLSTLLPNDADMICCIRRSVSSSTDECSDERCVYGDGTNKKRTMYITGGKSTSEGVFLEAKDDIVIAYEKSSEKENGYKINPRNYFMLFRDSKNWTNPLSANEANYEVHKQVNGKTTFVE